jgi:hypothetical protein
MKKFLIMLAIVIAAVILLAGLQRLAPSCSDGDG